MERFGEDPRFSIIENDIIKVRLSDLDGSGFKIIGNIPYNISGALIDWLIANVKMIDSVVITVQKEVADRIRAFPGNREYGSLSALTQTYYKVARAFDIPPGCFSPPPKVKSSVLKLTPDIKLHAAIDYNEFREFVYGCFSQKRKTLVNSLGFSGNFDKAEIEKSLVSLGKRTDIRAEHLSCLELMSLFSLLTDDE